MPLYQARRIVTANDTHGKSYVLDDRATPHVLETGTDRGLIDFWATAPGADTAEGGDGVILPMQLYPPAGGTVFRLFQVAPASQPYDPASAAAAFAAMRASDVRSDTSLHPGMHLSHTIDYVIVLRGRLKLLLEKGEVELNPFDVVVQRETNHAWINLGEEPALCAAVLVDAAAC
jgi:hypothetical protein